MRFNIAQALCLRFPPLAIFYAQAPPSETNELKPICSMLLVAQAAKGKTVAITQGSCRCPGVGKGFGLESSYSENFPGGRECFMHFFPTHKQDWEHGRAMMQKLTKGGAPKPMVGEFSGGDDFLKTPELVAQWLEKLPNLKPEGPYVVIKPLDTLVSGEKPKIVTFLIEPDQLPELADLANHACPGINTVWVPFAAGCASLALYPLYEAAQANPRAVIGLTDISTRFYLRKVLGKDVVSFTVPWSMFEEMEGNVSASLLTRCA